MRTFTMIAASLALLTATACTETEAPVQTADPTPNEASPAPIDTASPTAIYLECKTDDERSAQPITTYRIDPVENTWSWWNEGADNGGPEWEVFSCADENRQCTFEDTVFSNEWSAGALYAEVTKINRTTGEMERKTYSEGNGWLIWQHMCTPVGNPADALVKKF
jgi:hypothetical protein